MGSARCAAALGTPAMAPRARPPVAATLPMAASVASAFVLSVSLPPAERGHAVLRFHVVTSHSQTDSIWSAIPGANAARCHPCLRPSGRAICRLSSSLAYVATHQACCYQPACEARYRSCGQQLAGRDFYPLECATLPCRNQNPKLYSLSPKLCARSAYPVRASIAQIPHLQ